MSRRTVVLLLAAALGALSGCNYIAALTYFLHPPRIQKAEFVFPPENVALIVDYARPEQEDPVFNRALQLRLEEIFREQKVSAALVPLEDVLRLRQISPDFSKWSLQRIGRELDAAFVLYVRIEALSMRPNAAHPLLEPKIALTAKVVDTEAPAELARIWPSGEESEGRGLSCARPAREVGDVARMDDESTKLARDTAAQLAMYFYDVDLENPPPKEK